MHCRVAPTVLLASKRHWNDLEGSEIGQEGPFSAAAFVCEQGEVKGES
jgi:hypothetical protein